MKRRKLQKGDLQKSILTEQKCQMCSYTEEIDSGTIAFLCYRCVFQMSHHIQQMPMLAIESGPCKKCGAETHQILRTMSADKSHIIEQFVCQDCHEVKEIVDEKRIEKSDRPAGWRFMKEFVDKDGTVYHVGEEQPELKGTLLPTDVAAVKAAQKEKRKANKKKKEERQLKKEARLAKEYKKKQKMIDKQEAQEKEEQRKEKFFDS